MKKRDIILILSILLLSLSGAAFAMPVGDVGNAYVYVGGDLYGCYDLSQDMTFSIDNGNGISNVIEIIGGRIRMKEATCPGNDCVHCGYISRSGESICCAPAGIVIVIRQKDGDYDAITK